MYCGTLATSCAGHPARTGGIMFAVASILAILGGWVLLATLLDWDSCLGVIDLRAAGEVMGDDDLARWVFGGGGAVLLLAGLVCAL